MNSTEIETALANKHAGDFFITECKNGPTWWGGHLRMDAIAIKKSWANPCVTAYEVKVSRGDFLRDSKWPEYLQYCNRFYFACPTGLIKKGDVPDPRVGLIWINEKGNCRTVKAVPARPVEIPSEFYRYILFSRLDSERIPFYSKKAEYIKDFIQHKKDARSLGHEFSSTLVHRVAQLEDQIQEKDDTLIGKKAKLYDELRETLKKYGIDCWWDGSLSKQVDEVFERVEREENKIELFDRIAPLAQKIAALAQTPKEAG